MAYLGNTPTTQSFISGTDYFNGDGSTVAFTLSRTVASVNDIEVVINNVEQQPNTAYTVSGTTITFTSAPSAGTANIYVRYLSTTTQSITPSQNTVSYSTLNSDNQSKLGISFKNRVINGGMVIAQRGTSTTSTAFLNQVDQFQVATNAGTFTFGQSTNAPANFSNSAIVTNTSSLTPSGTNYYAIRNALEGLNVADLAWGSVYAKTVTLSFWVRSSVTGTFGGSIFNGSANYSYPFSYTISSANTWEQKAITITGAPAGTWATDNSTGLYIEWALGTGSTYQGTAGAWSATRYQGVTGQTQWSTTNGATFYLTGVQFEVGTQATTFDYRSYGTELQLCQRYYEIGGSDYSTIFSGNTTNGSLYYVAAVFKVTKRAGATGTITTIANNGFPATAAGIGGSSPTTGFQLNKGANATQSGSYFVESWTASAEL